MDQTIGCEDHGAAELIRRAEKIAHFAAGFFDKQDAGGGVPAIEAEFPEAVEAADGNGGEIEGGGAVAANTVGAEREVVIIVNIRARLTLVNGETGAKEASRERGNFGDGDFLAIEGGAFATGGGEEFFINGIVDDAGDDSVAVSEGDGHAEAGIAVGKIRGAVERVDVPAVLGVVILANAFFGSDGMRRKIFRETIDDVLFAALVGLGDEVDVTFVFDLGRTRVLFAEDFSSFEGGFDGDFEIGFQNVRQARPPRES